MPKKKSKKSDDTPKCFLCAKVFRDMPGPNIVFFDEAAGRFVEGKEPRICHGHKDALRVMPRDRRREAYSGFEIMPRTVRGEEILAGQRDGL